MVIIETPASAERESSYTLGVVMDEWLGLSWRQTRSAHGDVCIRITNQPGEIRLPNTFFTHIEAHWLDPASLPDLPLRRWSTQDLSSEILLANAEVPVLFGDSDPRVEQSGAERGVRIRLPIDILGSAFFMLSRYEEAVLACRDEHDRFPASASLAHREGFLDRPIVDEYVEILWTAMKRLWPGLERRPRHSRTIVSCDVDRGFQFDGSLKGMPRRFAGDLLKRRAPAVAGRNALAAIEARWGRHARDPYRLGLEYIMQVNERAGHPAAFYFIPEKTHPEFDKPVGLDDPRMRALFREIHGRGHEIGIHPGYNTYKHPEAMARSVQTLRRVLDEEGIQQSQLGGRQHYLRWETPTTARLWDENNLDYDSTLSFADRPGFRCGTCREYPLYDLHRRRSLRVRERPLIVMECSVFAAKYLGLSYNDEAQTKIRHYRDTCHRFGGSFTLLWHNTQLQTRNQTELYIALIS